MIETNKLTNMEVVQAALWDEDGEGELHLATKTGWHSLTPRPGLPEVGTVAVRLVKLDHLVEELGIDRVDAVKIDVEGAEIQVLLGARDPHPLSPVRRHGHRRAAHRGRVHQVFESVDYEVRLPGGKELRRDARPRPASDDVTGHAVLRAGELDHQVAAVAPTDRGVAPRRSSHSKIVRTTGQR